MTGFTTRPEIRGSFGVTTSTHWIASTVGFGILEKGGNAFDAAVAAGFVLQVVEPHLNGPAGDLPIIIYNIPGRTASNIAPETLGRLAEIDCIVGVKESSGDLDQVAHAVDLCPEDFAVLSGDDALTLPLLSVGGHGVISTTANVAPEKMGDLVRAWQAGKPSEARAVHFQLLPLFDLLFCETNPIPVKAALEMMGCLDGEIRLPLTPLTEAHRGPLREALQSAGCLS